jgi:hypothetical protein
MDEPIWLHSGVILPMHRLLCDRYGGPTGIREPGGIDAALALSEMGTSALLSRLQWRFFG